MFLKDKINHQTDLAHRALQILVKAAKSWLLNKDDDSHTNLHWNVATSSFQSHLFPLDIQLALNLKSSTLEIHKNGSLAHSISLSGMQQVRLEKEFADALLNVGLKKDSWNSQLHYELPYSDFKEFIYPELDENSFHDFRSIRDFGQRVLQSLESHESQDLGLRTWPHHFDLGGLISLKQNEKSETIASVGLGLAMQDSEIDEYYFYLSPWKKDFKISAEDALNPKFGEWHAKMAMYVLKISEINNSDLKNEELANQFFKETFFSSKSILKLD